MTRYNYAFKTNKENVVRIVGRDLGLSRKKSVEMCKFIKGREIAKAKAILEKVKEKQLAVPFTRSTNGAGHRKGPMAGGKYPLKGAMEFLKLLKQLEANAQAKGLSSSLKIIHACAQQASEPFRYGRKRRVQMKRCHIELAAQEIEGKKHAKQAHTSKHEAKSEAKSETGTKPAAKAESKKEEMRSDRVTSTTRSKTSLEKIEKSE
ncbi:50S ribosomal protein L22 [Candidatus Woesearchaeota archaeon]|nr:50S ribosomal protein L22 [Candidatus Woesearchaeota archaeon]